MAMGAFFFPKQFHISMNDSVVNQTEYMNGMVVPVQSIKYTYTGSKEHLVFIWKVSTDVFDSNILTKNVEIIIKVSY